MKLKSVSLKIKRIICKPLRTTAVNFSYRLLRNVAKKQLIELKKQDKDPLFLKSNRHHYIFQITKSFWRDTDFSFSLRHKKWNFYSVYPIRTVMEKYLKMNYFMTKNNTEQDEIAEKEFLLACKKIYEFSRNRNYDTSEIVKIYRDFNNTFRNTYADVGAIAFKNLKSFPTYEKLCKNSSIQGENNYDYYRWLSSIPHGELGHTMFLKVIGGGEYRRITMWGNLICHEMLKLTDVYLNNSTKKEIEKSFRNVQSLTRFFFL